MGLFRFSHRIRAHTCYSFTDQSIDTELVAFCIINSLMPTRKNFSTLSQWYEEIEHNNGYNFQFLSLIFFFWHVAVCRKALQIYDFMMGEGNSWELFWRKVSYANVRNMTFVRSPDFTLKKTKNVSILTSIYVKLKNFFQSHFVKSLRVARVNFFLETSFTNTTVSSQVTRTRPD